MEVSESIVWLLFFLGIFLCPTMVVMLVVWIMDINERKKIN